MKDQREYTSLEVSKALQEIGFGIESDCKYFWQEKRNRNLVDPGQSTFVLGDPTFVVGPKIQQGSTALYEQITEVCPAYTFLQLFDWLKTAWTSLPDSSSPADQIARYIIMTRK
jgi:hypothetical protein